MNAAVTLGVNKVDGKPVYTIITEPNVPHKEQRRNFRKLRRELHGKFEEVQLWTSTAGRVKRQRTCAQELPPVAPVVPSAEDLLGGSPESTQVGTESQQPDNSGGEPTQTPVPDKKAAGLAKARAAAAAKKLAKAKK